MAIQNIAIGTPGAGGGDPAHVAFTKINQNFSNPQHAASRMVGVNLGDVMEVGAFGIGRLVGDYDRGTGLDLSAHGIHNGFYAGNDWKNAPFPTNNQTWGYLIHQNLASGGSGYFSFQLFSDLNGVLYSRAKVSQADRPWARHYTSQNTTVDGNGFIKAASPIVKLFSDRIELNDEAQQQPIIFEKLDIGDYIIQRSSGFAQEGWYVETPKDANGNILFSVIYTTLENGDISVKSYKKKFDLETASIVADLDKPVDITEGRWIDIRLQELPQPEIETPEPVTPPDFQTTGIAQAVSEMMNGTEQ